MYGVCAGLLQGTKLRAWQCGSDASDCPELQARAPLVAACCLMIMRSTGATVHRHFYRSTLFLHQSSADKGEEEEEEKKGDEEEEEECWKSCQGEQKLKVNVAGDGAWLGQAKRQ